MSRMIDRLTREGLVRREACEDDGRGAEVALTPTGRGVLRAARASHLAGVRAEFLDRFDDDELARLAGIWERLTPRATPEAPRGRRRKGLPTTPPVAPRPVARPSDPGDRRGRVARPTGVDDTLSGPPRGGLRRVETG